MICGRSQGNYCAVVIKMVSCFLVLRVSTVKGSDLELHGAATAGHELPAPNPKPEIL